MGNSFVMSFTILLTLKKDVEKVTLAHTGKLLAVLHDSIDMFVQIYKDCNPATGFTDEKSDMEKALQEAS